ncbi:unnamed protein product [Linum trigynum]|uniref:Uncharacterized protein n=1 Tax=Linum trigynum TaxID=586398 RepID=A0AAV2F1D3_9ROSI
MAPDKGTKAEDTKSTSGMASGMGTKSARQSWPRVRVPSPGKGFKAEGTKSARLWPQVTDKRAEGIKSAKQSCGPR